MTKIQTFGPKEVHEAVVTQNGVSQVLRYEYYAEAVGSDGRGYYTTSRGRPTPYVRAQEQLREITAKILEVRMKEEGVWTDEDQPGQP